jgi:hypothetical protein
MVADVALVVICVACVAVIVFSGRLAEGLSGVDEDAPVGPLRPPQLKILRAGLALAAAIVLVGALVALLG